MIGHPLKVRELLGEIANDEVLLPEIQRAYVWKGPQVSKLLDSLYCEYPAGQILLWDTANLPITKRLEGVEKAVLPRAGQPKIVLDGQQRLTSLFKALAPRNGNEDAGQKDGDDEDSRVDVYFNLETETFQLYLRRLDSDPTWVSVRAIFNNERHDLDILEDLEKRAGLDRKDPKAKHYIDRLQKLRRIGDFKFPIEIFKSDDYEQVTELFVRINSAGTRLRAAELVLAQLALRLPGALVGKIDSALDDYDEYGYELDARLMTRALIALGTGQSRFRYLTEFWKKTPAEIEAVWTRTRKAIDSAVNFTRQNARFESSDWLPSLSALIILAAFFDKHPKIAPGVEKELLRWFYLAALRGRYSGSGETAMDEDLKAVASDEPVVTLLKNASVIAAQSEVAPEEFDDAGPRNPLFALTYAVARKRGAKDWFKGIGLATDVVGQEHQIEVHHVFPKALLKKAGVRRKDRDEIANLAFLAAKPNKAISSQPLEVYLVPIAAAHPERLEAQCIPTDRSLWRLDRFQDFLEARRHLLAKAVSDLVADP